MKIRCLVVDDERLALEVMEAYIEKVPYLRLDALCATPLEALDYLSRNQVDVIFLDVEMPGLNGLQLLKTLKDPPRIILTTAFPQFAVDAFELDVFDYLLKPIPFPRFLQSAQKLSGATVTPQPDDHRDSPASHSREPYFFVKSGSKTLRLDFDKILYIEGKKDHTLIHLLDGEAPTYLPLSQILDKLAPDRFLRVHRSFIVAIEKIASIEQNRIQIGKAVIPIGEYYRTSFLKRIE
jgi:DNA-binding LytR/AlgR family response regulator